MLPEYRPFPGQGIDPDGGLKGIETPHTQSYCTIESGDRIAIRELTGKKILQDDYEDPAMLRTGPARLKLLGIKAKAEGDYAKGNRHN